MPVSRLNERPTREATLVDITCDSDGQVNKFIDLRDIRDTLPLHPLNTNGNGQLEPDYLGFFLMGAYQDIMGTCITSSGVSTRSMSFSNRTNPPAIMSRRSSRGARSSSASPRSSMTRTS